MIFNLVNLIKSLFKLGFYLLGMAQFCHVLFCLLYLFFFFLLVCLVPPQYSHRNYHYY